MEGSTGLVYMRPRDNIASIGSTNAISRPCDMTMHHHAGCWNLRHEDPWNSISLANRLSDG